ncbi:type I polyketide synthase [Vibrio aerogenes]|nr:type I polyketide synthase [Vibrio aerogenes]
MESADGRCYAFDSRANGTVFSRGVGVVLLKRLKDAIRDGDHIHAVIKGGAINNDGNLKAGYTAPSIEGQIAVAKRAIENAGINAEDIRFVEAHGTATALGDPIEFTSLTQTFQSFTDKKQFCRLGSVKTNIGHTDAASAMASMIKAAKALKTGQLPASLHYLSPNPNIEFESSPFYMNTALSPLENDGKPVNALVNSFGVGGTNGCVILETPPVQAESDPHHAPLVLPFSAKSRSAVEAMKKRLHSYLENHDDVSLADVAYTLQTGRQQFDFSSVVIGSNREALLEKLMQPSAILTRDGKQKKSLVFMFPGQGNQYPDMAKDLYNTYPVFREAMDQCCDILRPILACDIKPVIFSAGTDNAPRLNETQFTQPALFVIEYCLAQLWMSWGIKPDIMIGHSVGEYVAACIAEVFSLDDALRAVAVRGKLVQSLPSGSMLAVMMDEAQLKARLKDTRIEIAAVNYPELCVVAGNDEEIAAFQREIEDDAIFCKHLDTSHGFHSYMMEPVLPEFKQFIDGVELHHPKIPFVSSVTGDWITDELATDADYWVQHVRKPVLFSHAFRTLMQDSPARYICLEVGPGRSLESAGKQHFRADDGEMPVIYSSLPTAKDADISGTYLLNTFGSLWASGLAVPWEKLYTGEVRHRLPLPGYPFERKTFALPPVRSSGVSGSDAEALNLRKQKKADIGDWFYMPAWRRTVPAQFIPEKQRAAKEEASETCWVVFADEHGIAAEVKHQLTESGQTVFAVMKGDSFHVDDSQNCIIINPSEREDYVRMLKAIKDTGLLPTRILHLWNTGTKTIDFDGTQSRDELQQDGFYGPLYLQQALIGQNLLEGLHLVFVASNVVSVAGEPILSPEKALLMGPSRVFYHEYGDVQSHLVDVDLSGSFNPKAIATHLIAEAHIHSDSEHIAYRGGFRWEEDYQAVHLESGQQGMPASFSDDCTYLITGGLGGLGMLVAKHIAGRSKAGLILLYRSPLPQRDAWQSWLETHPVDDPISEKLAGILQLEENGNTVHLVEADVCDYEAMSQALSGFSRIDGIFHTAGIAGGGIIPFKKDEECAMVLDPKVQGALILDALTKKHAPEFFILFSSISAIVSDEARIDYCAGNAFMDTFAQYRNQHRPGRTVSLNWGKWGDVGMAVRWTKIMVEKDKEKEKQNGVAAPEGDLLTLMDRKGMQEMYQVNLDPHQDWVLSEHRLIEQPTLVGTSILSILNEYMTVFKPDASLQVKNLLLASPVIYHKSWPRLLCLFVEPDGQGYSFSLRSRGVLEMTWQDHAMGSMKTAGETSVVIESLSTLQDRCTQPVEVTSMAKDFANQITGEVFLTLGERWNSHSDVYQGNHEWLMRVGLPEQFRDDFQRFPLHPAMMDAVSIRCIFKTSEDNFLPLSYGTISVLGSLEEATHVHVKYKQPYQQTDNTVVMDIVFFAAENGGAESRPIVIVENYTMVKMRADNQVDESSAPARPQAVKVDLSDKDILFFEGTDALKRQLSHLEFSQLVVVTSDLHQLIEEAIPEQEEDVSVADEAAMSGYERPELSVAYVAPDNDIEKEIAKVWQSTLGINGIGVNDNFVELGGNSLLAVQVVSKVSAIFEVDIRVDLFYQDQTVKGLANLIMAEFESLLAD